jgi:phage host-nuclease inhibitor protein Gam
MTRRLSISLSLVLLSACSPLRAANKPHAKRASEANVIWTNDDLERLRDKGLISIVGQIEEEATEAATAPTPYMRTKDPEWYAAQADSVRAELESTQAELQDYIQAIEDARSLKTMTGGINLDQGDIGITLEAGIEILQRRVREAQSELDALEDLARHNGIPPGTLRGD